MPCLGRSSRFGEHESRTPLVEISLELKRMVTRSALAPPRVTIGDASIATRFRIVKPAAPVRPIHSYCQYFGAPGTSANVTLKAVAAHPVRYPSGLTREPSAATVLPSPSRGRGETELSSDGRPVSRRGASAALGPTMCLDGNMNV